MLVGLYCDILSIFMVSCDRNNVILLWLITNNLTTVAANPAVVYTYNGYFNMSETTFVTELLTSSSAQYIALENEVKSAVRTRGCQ